MEIDEQWKRAMVSGDGADAPGLGGGVDWGTPASPALCQASLCLILGGSTVHSTALGYLLQDGP